ncbi:MAG: MFS transporter [Erysipelotrichaceae bacterium]|nr:MFS transporter [Erysipelotrichaceae bacterium]
MKDNGTENRMREQEEISRLKKAKSKKSGKYYFIILIGLILLVDIIDNITTNATGSVTSAFIREFFIEGHLFGNTYDLNSGLALHNTINLIGYVIGLLTPFYKAQADRYGRKPLFVISTLGMTVGLLTVYFSKSYFVFLLGNFIMTFFLSHDIQIIYLLEEAPSKYRATVYSFIKGLGGLSAILLPLMRDFLLHNNETLWRNIFLLPGIAGLIICVLVFLFARETETFVDGRLAYLQIPYEERQKQKKELKRQKKADSNKAGIVNAIKFIFSNKELRNLIIIKTIFDAAIIAVTNYEPIMTEAGMTPENKTIALYFYPVIYCVSVMISGILADRWGRKKTIVLFGTICFITFAMFVVSARKLWNPQIVGLMYGLYLGGYWIGRDYMEIVSTEMVPTEIRASIVGAEGLLVYIGMALGFAFVNVGILFMPIWLTCLVFIVPCVSISIVLFSMKIRETKGIDYRSIQ